ncbi:MAG: peptidase c1a, papain [Thermoanaerobaculia bacterium]
MAPLSRSGWKPTPFDSRDFTFDAETLEVEPNPSRRRVEIGHPIDPRSQGEVPCCVSIAIASAMEALDAFQAPFLELSPLFNYFTARNDPRRLGFLDIREGFKAATNEGICRLDLHDVTFDRAGAETEPSEEARADALQQRLKPIDPITFQTSYWRLPDSGRVEAWRSALAEGLPIVTGLWVTGGYWRLRDELDVYPDDLGDPARDGHAVIVLGYDDDREGGAFLIKDSRGSNFGDAGHWWLPYRLAATRLVAEGWAVTRITYN